mgnify:CR=1 FL=1
MVGPKIQLTMKKRYILGIILMTMALTACDKSKMASTERIERLIQEIEDAEAAFAQMVKEQGMNKAFVSFAADGAVLMRGNQLIMGKGEIQKFMENQTSRGLSWKPEYIDVSSSGDLAYTYGYYTFTYPDSTGAEVEAKGVFHTVWKRQQDGSWKFVWD